MNECMYNVTVYSFLDMCLPKERLLSISVCCNIYGSSSPSEFEQYTSGNPQSERWLQWDSRIFLDLT